MVSAYTYICFAGSVSDTTQTDATREDLTLGQLRQYATNATQAGAIDLVTATALKDIQGHLHATGPMRGHARVHRAAACLHLVQEVVHVHALVRVRFVLALNVDKA